MATVEEQQALKQALREVAIAAAEVEVQLKGVDLALGAVGRTQAAATLKELQGIQIDLAKSIGDQAAPALERIKKTFEDVNSASRNLGIGQADIAKAFGTTTESFKFTGLAAETVARSIAANSKVIEESKLISFTKDFGLQAGLAATQAAKLGERLTATAIKAGLPRDELLKLSQGLLNSGVVFGSSISQIESLTTRTTAFGRALGTTGDAIRTQLGAMMTIGDRQQLAARLSQIGSMVGAQVDVAKLMSADPAEQEEALRQTLSSFSQQFQQLQSPAQKRALMLALSKTLRLPAQAIQTALTKGVDISKAVEDVNKAREASQKGIDDGLRRQFRTTEEALNQFVAVLKQQRGLIQMEALNMAVAKIGGSTDKNAKSIDKLDENMIKFVQAVDKLATVAGTSAGVAVGGAFDIGAGLATGDTTKITQALLAVGKKMGEAIGEAAVEKIKDSLLGGVLRPKPNN